MLNLGSFLLGLCAWALGLTAMAKKGRMPWLTFGSFTLCGLSLVLQCFEIHRRVTLEDWSALMDTTGALAKVAVVLLVVTVVLNAIALLRGRTKQ